MQQLNTKSNLLTVSIHAMSIEHSVVYMVYTNHLESLLYRVSSDERHMTKIGDKKQGIWWIDKILDYLWRWAMLTENGEARDYFFCREKMCWSHTKGIKPMALLGCMCVVHWQWCQPKSANNQHRVDEIRKRKKIKINTFVNKDHLLDP